MSFITALVKRIKIFSSSVCISLHPPASSIEANIGFVRWNSTRIPTHFVRHYWFIEPSSVDRPNIVLFRMDETITFNPNVHPIRLPFYQDFAYDGWSSLMLGFRSPVGQSTPHHLQSDQASIFGNNLCHFAGNVADHEICAIDGGEPSQSGPTRRFNTFTGKSHFHFSFLSSTGFLNW